MVAGCGDGAIVAVGEIAVAVAVTSGGKVGVGSPCFCEQAVLTANAIRNTAAAIA